METLQHTLAPIVINVHIVYTPQLHMRCFCQTAQPGCLVLRKYVCASSPHKRPFRRIISQQHCHWMNTLPYCAFWMVTCSSVILLVLLLPRVLLLYWFRIWILPIYRVYRDTFLRYRDMPKISISPSTILMAVEYTYALSTYISSSCLPSLGITVIEGGPQEVQKKHCSPSHQLQLLCLVEVSHFPH